MGRDVASGRHCVGSHAADQSSRVTIVVRLRRDPRTRAYAERRTEEGLSKMEIIRCLKRYLAREVYRTLCADLQEPNGT
jgi:hypothetical protein